MKCVLSSSPSSYLSKEKKTALMVQRHYKAMMMFGPGEKQR